MSNNQCCCSSQDTRDQELQKIIEKHKNRRGGLIPVLHEVQELYGYLPIEVQKVISERMGIPLTEIYGVVTFYSLFTLKPKGKYKIQVCMGTACYVRGASAILERISERLGIKVGECSDDGLFSLDVCRCIGACGLAPAIMVNDQVYGAMTPEKILDVIEKYDNL